MHSQHPEDNQSGLSPKATEKDQPSGLFQEGSIRLSAQSQDVQQVWVPSRVPHSTTHRNWISSTAPKEGTYKNIIGMPSPELLANWIRRDSNRNPSVSINLTKIRGMLGIKNDGRHWLKNRAAQEPYYTMGRGTYVTLSTALAFLTSYAPHESLVPSIICELQERELRDGGKNARIEEKEAEKGEGVAGLRIFAP